MSNSNYISVKNVFGESFFNKSEKILIRVKVVPKMNVSWIEYKAIVDVFNISCNKGENEKCRSCSENNETLLNCLTCNVGYYLPNENIYTLTKCRKCKDNCNECEGDYYYNYCTKCKEGFSLILYECKM